MAVVADAVVVAFVGVTVVGVGVGVVEVFSRVVGEGESERRLVVLGEETTVVPGVFWEVKSCLKMEISWKIKGKKNRNFRR